MIVAVTSSGNRLDSKIDKLCGRCSYFMLYYSKSKTKVFHANPYYDAEDNIAEAVTDFFKKQKVSMLVTGSIGARMEAALTQKGIRVVLNNPDVSIEEIINYISEKEIIS